MTVKHTHKKPQKKSFLQIIWGTYWSKFITLFSLLVIIASAAVVYFSRDLPSFEQLENYTPNLATKIYSSDGVLLKELYTEKRSYTPLSQIPQKMINAVLATEDHRFFQHWGIAPLRLIKVTLKYVFTGSKQQGASTLTQQLARQLYLTLEKTVTRKIKEILTAIEIERTYTKSEILEMYMNHMIFGHGTYGVQAASQTYFGKDVNDLTIAQCALLAGMLQRPASYYPYRFPERAKKRRNVVLGRMLAEKYITREEYEQAIASDLGIIPQKEEAKDEFAAYFTEYVRRNLQKKYGWDLYKGGMKIYTTLDSRVQACAERAVKKLLPERQAVVNRNMRKEKQFVKLVPPSLLRKHTLSELMANKTFVDSLINEKCRVQVALVAIDPRNGHILAMIGGRSFKESQFNRAVQAVRQPGSIFKPFVYTAAVDNGYMPYYEKLNQPIVVHLYDGTRWTPHNYDGSIGGKTTLREGLRRSLNLVTARLVQEDVPPEIVIKYARNLGITTPLDPVDAIALGSCGVIPIQVISAFGVFANKGVLVKPMSVLRVEDKYGNVLEKNVSQSKGVLREQTAYIMNSLLQTVERRGTGASSRSVYHFMRPAGGKTGTTNDFTDAWYITFTPQIVGGTWVGVDDPSLSLGKRQSGARVALPITATFMKAAHDTLHLPVLDFPRPDGIVDVEICRESKLLATKYCPDVIKDIADVRYAPKEYCNIHTGKRDKNEVKREQRQNKRRKIRY